ncbi:MAG: OmpH family outer membrane protein [Spirochaetaceae bacterium]|jgi:outer membrane protein|nr:OmpH family outer membrane protein [Spirochaetaceae bacterium]
MKKICLIAGLFFLNLSVFSQQITRFAVVDTAKIYTTYYRESSGVRKYDSRKEEFQKEANRLAEELKALQAKKIELQNKGEDYEAVKLQTEITNKALYLSEYTKSKNLELETMKKQMSYSDDFYKKLYNAISRVAESEGYSMILSLQNDKSILWYSPSVDITAKVLDELKKSR